MKVFPNAYEWLRQRPALSLALAILLTAAACGPESKFQTAGEELVIENLGGRHHFVVEIAATEQERAQGLMYRTTLARNEGMLFQYPVPRTLSMWMANTYIPLDMLFIGTDGRIVSIAERTIPESLQTIASEGPAIAVLEVNAGTSDRLNIEPGDLVIHPFFGNAN